MSDHIERDLDRILRDLVDRGVATQRAVDSVVAVETASLAARMADNPNGYRQRRARRLSAAMRRARGRRR